MFRSDSTIFRSLRAQICICNICVKIRDGIPFTLFGIIVFKKLYKLYGKMIVVKCLTLISPLTKTVETGDINLRHFNTIIFPYNLSLFFKNYYTEQCKWDPIAYFDTYVAYYISELLRT